MKSIGRERPFSNPRLSLALVAAGLLLILLASLGLVNGSANARDGPGCASPNGCPDNRLTSLGQVGKIVGQDAKLVMANSGQGVLYTPMPASYQPDNAVLLTDQGNQPFFNDLFLFGFAAIATLMALGPLALAAIMDLRSARRQ